MKNNKPKNLKICSNCKTWVGKDVKKCYVCKSEVFN